MKFPRILLALALISSLFLAGCGSASVETTVTPTGAVAKTVSKERFQFFRKPPADREYVVVAEVVAKTSSLNSAKKAFSKAAKQVKAQAAINIEPVRVGSYRGLAVNNWKAQLIIWQ